MGQTFTQDVRIAIRNVDIKGTGASDNMLAGTNGDDIIFGLDRADTITGGGGNNRIWGEAAFRAPLEQRSASIAAFLNADDIDGGPGEDILYGGTGHDILYGGPGRDIIDGQQGSDFLSYRNWTPPDPDSTTGVALSLNVMAGSDGYKSVERHLEMVEAGLSDLVRNVENLIGSNSMDTLIGDAGDNILLGLGQDDCLNGRVGNDILVGGAGGDKISGNAGNDTLVGGRGNDTLYGGDGDDWLWGDIVSRMSVTTTKGNDTLWGGAGRDVFVMHHNTSKTDIVKDFVAGEDKIAFNNSTFTNLSDNPSLRLIKDNNDVLLQNPFSNANYMRIENIDNATLALMQDDANFSTYFEVV